MTATGQPNPRLWFNQFERWYSANPQAGNGQWCARHWAPAPCLGANGIGATVELMQVFVSLPEVAKLADKKAENLNKVMESFGPICCRLGDQAMFAIWANWPPKEARS